MKVITSRKLVIPGYGIIEKGTELNCTEQNSKFVYVQIGDKTVKLSKEKYIGKRKFR